MVFTRRSCFSIMLLFFAGEDKTSSLGISFGFYLYPIATMYFFFFWLYMSLRVSVGVFFSFRMVHRMSHKACVRPVHAR